MLDDGHEKKRSHGLDDLDFKTARLDEMAQALRDLEHLKQGLLEEVRVLRACLIEEKEDQSDMYYFLHKKLDDKFDIICALERQLMVETVDREKAETEYLREIEELRHERDEELEPLKEKLAGLEKQVNSMRDAAESKRECDAVRGRLEEELQATESKVETDLDFERRKKIQEKQRVRRQVDVEIKELSTDLLWKKEAELADKTARAMENNEKLRVALQAKAKQAERMMVGNQRLAFENTSLRNDLELAKVSEAVLSKRVQAYYNLMVGLKVQLKQQAAVNENERQALADLEESLADSNKGLGGSAVDTASLTSNTSGAQATWASRACGGLVYESVDELRVTVESIQRLHEDLQDKARMAAARVKEVEAAATTGSGNPRVDLLTERLLTTCRHWMMTIQASPKRASGSIIPRADTGEHIARWSAGGGGRDLTASSARRRRDPRNKLFEARGKDISHRPRTSALPKARGRGRMPEETVRRSNSSPGPLAAVASTDALRRDLFYALVDTFKDHQGKNQSDASSNEAKGRGTGEELSFQRAEDPIALPIADQRHLGCDMNASGLHLNDGIAPTTADAERREASNPEIGGGRKRSTENGGKSSTRDIFPSLYSSVWCDFAASEVRDVSTQTVAKHFPENLRSVLPARRLVVSSTFVISGSVFSANSSSCNGGPGAWSRPAAQLHRD